MAIENTTATKVDLSPIRDEIATAGETLTFNEAGLRPAVIACAELLKILIDAQGYAHSLTFRSGFDAIASAGQLALGLSDRADGDDSGSFKQSINEHIKTIRCLQEALENAGRRYLSAEDSNTINNIAASHGLPPATTEKHITASGQHEETKTVEKPTAVENSVIPNKLNPTGHA